MVIIHLKDFSKLLLLLHQYSLFLHQNPTLSLSQSATITTIFFSSLSNTITETTSTTRSQTIQKSIDAEVYDKPKKKEIEKEKKKEKDKKKRKENEKEKTKKKKRERERERVRFSINKDSKIKK
jgi:outer membrane biosynthesis protein TonB